MPAESASESSVVLLKRPKQGWDLLNSAMMHYLKNSGKVRWRILQPPQPQTAFKSGNWCAGSDGSNTASFLKWWILAFNSWAIRDCKTCSGFPSVSDWLFSHLLLADNQSSQRQSLLLKYMAYPFSGYMLLACVVKKSLCWFTKTETMLLL